MELNEISATRINMDPNKISVTGSTVELNEISVIGSTMHPNEISIAGSTMDLNDFSIAGSTMELNKISVTNPQTFNVSQKLISNGNFQILEEGPQVSQDFISNGNFQILEEGPQVSQEVMEVSNGNFQILEEGPQVSQDLHVTNVRNIEEQLILSQDLSITNLRIMEERLQLCPLCSQELRLYYITYAEKIEMCENLECDFPFGYEPLKVFREDNGMQTVEMKSLASKTRSMGCSQGSTQGWSDVDKLCTAFVSDDAPNVDFSKRKSMSQLKKAESDQRKAELLANVEKIKQMTKSMSDMKQESKRVIKNEKWIKNLQYLQGLSGCNLLKPAEMKKIKKKSSGSKEFKIDFDKNNLASIKIEVNPGVFPVVKSV